MKKKTEYTRAVGPFTGIDVTSDDSAVSADRMPYLVNMWRDWESENGAAIETIPGYRKIPWNLNGAKIHNMWAAKFYDGTGIGDFLIIHSGAALYACRTSERDDVNANVYTIGTIADADSNGFAFGEFFYVLDGSDLWKISCTVGQNVSFDLTRLGDYEDGEELRTEAYIPTTYSDGSEYEQRNMLTNRFYNAYNMQDPEKLDWYNGLILEELDEKKKTLQVLGAHQGLTHIYVPSEVTWNGEKYRITTIGEEAFKDHKLRSLVLSSGVIDIGKNACFGCSSLETLVAHGVETIGQWAFEQCSSLGRIILPNTIKDMDPNEFTDIPTQANIYYGGNDNENTDIYGKLKNICNSKDSILKENVTLIEATVGETFTVPVDLIKATKYAILSNIVMGAIEKTGLNEDTEVQSVEFKAKERTSWIGVAFRDSIKETNYEKLVVVTVVENGTCVNDKESTIRSFRFDIMDPCKSVEEVTINGKKVAPEGENSFETPNYSLLAENLNEKKYIRAVVITADEKKIKGQKLVAKGIAYDSEFSRSKAGNAYTYDNGGYKGTSVEAIRKCTIAAEYDGRIFLTGNPNLPNTVFYSHRNLQGANDPTYFGQLNYFNDGTGMNQNRSLLSTPSYLAVIKADSIGGGAIYYHTPSETEYDIIPKIYPGAKGTAGIGSLGPCINFRDDPVFISAMGLEGITLSSVNTERGIVHRSSNVDKWLLKHKNLSQAKLCEWKGYLMILLGGEVFMADSRQMAKHASGSAQYEWYFLNDVGEYVGQTDQYFFPSVSPVDADGRKFTDMYLNSTRKKFEVKREESLYNGEVKSAYPSFNATGTQGTDKYSIYYAEEYDENNVKHYYILDSYGEKIGGTFSAASAIAECGGVLYIGTESGSLFCFNTDKRGETYESDGIVEPVPSDQIHRSYYQRNGRRYLSGFSTKKDNCGAPQYDKDTCRRSLTIKGKTMLGSRYTVRVRTDREPWAELMEDHTMADMNGYDTDFFNSSLTTSGEMISTSRESKRRWVEKQYYLYSDGWCRPFGIYYLSYRYKISGLAGRIRRG